MKSNICLLCFDLKSPSSLSQAIKIFLLQNKEISFEIYTSSYSLKNYFSSIGGCKIIIEDREKIDKNKLIDQYQKIIDCSSESLNIEGDFSFYYYSRNKDSDSILLPFKRGEEEKIVFLLDKIQDLSFINKNIFYIENKEFINDKLIAILSQKNTYKGIINPDKFFKLEDGIYLIDLEKFIFIKSFYDALNDKQKEASERKSIASYFSKMVFSFQKDDAYERNSYNLFNYCFQIKKESIILNLSTLLTPSEIVIILKFLSKINFTNK